MTNVWGLQASDPRESIAVCCRLQPTPKRVSLRSLCVTPGTVFVATVTATEMFIMIEHVLLLGTQ